MKVDELIEEGIFDYIRGAAGKVKQGVQSVHQAGVAANAEAKLQKMALQWSKAFNALMLLTKQMRGAADDSMPELIDKFIRPSVDAPYLNQATNLLGGRAVARAAANPAPAPAAAQPAPAAAPTNTPAAKPVKRPTKGSLMAASKKRQADAAAAEKRNQELEHRKMVRAYSESKE